MTFILFAFIIYIDIRYGKYVNGKGVVFMLTLSEIVELKNTLIYGSDSKLHYHDVCPKPYFTLDRTDPKIQKIIDTYLSSKKHFAVYSPDGLQFTIERDRSC